MNNLNAHPQKEALFRHWGLYERPRAQPGKEQCLRVAPSPAVRIYPDAGTRIRADSLSLEMVSGE